MSTRHRILSYEYTPFSLSSCSKCSTDRVTTHLHISVLPHLMPTMYDQSSLDQRGSGRPKKYNMKCAKHFIQLLSSDNCYISEIDSCSYEKTKRCKQATEIQSFLSQGTTKVQVMADLCITKRLYVVASVKRTRREHLALSKRIPASWIKTLPGSSLKRGRIHKSTQVRFPALKYAYLYNSNASFEFLFSEV